MSDDVALLAVGSSAAGGSAASEAVGLLSLPNHVLEKILSCLYVKQLRTVIPLVCKRLCALQRDSTLLWQWYSLRARKCPNRHYNIPALLRWFAARRCAIQLLTLHISNNCNPAWLRIAGRVLALLSQPLVDLTLTTGSVRATTAHTNGLLAPLASMTQLRKLEVNLGHTWGAGRIQAPCLDSCKQLRHLAWSVEGAGMPGHLNALAGLTTLEIGHCHQSWEVQVAALTNLHSLGLSYAEGDGSDPALAFLSGLTSLRDLKLAHARLTFLPALLAGLPFLLSLSLLGNSFTEPEGSLDVLTRLPNLFTLDLQHCELWTLPPQLTALTLLSGLYIQHNPFLHLTSDCVLGVLARMPHLNLLMIDLLVAHGEAVKTNDWLRLGRSNRNLYICEI